MIFARNSRYFVLLPTYNTLIIDKRNINNLWSSRPSTFKQTNKKKKNPLMESFDLFIFFDQNSTLMVRFWFSVTVSLTLLKINIKCKYKTYYSPIEMNRKGIYYYIMYDHFTVYFEPFPLNSNCVYVVHIMHLCWPSLPFLQLLLLV